ncbi:MAG: M20 family metallopeptidase [Gemmatimonadota bacterium]|nr:M20 family metallopeptidase [Gemmatimonadota bacterium]
MGDPTPAPTPGRGRIASDVFDRIVAIRRDLHRHPELSGRERRTTDRVCQRLDELGIRHRRLGETGVIADLPGLAGDVPGVALRADLDALPIQERTGLEFASEEEGVMHACAHDGHTAMLLGAAEVLRGEELPAPVRLLFQPAEETGTGARWMLEEGALEGVGMIFAGHLDIEFRTGVLAVTRGPVNASVDTFRIVISGREGHAARPHEALDAVVVGSMLVMGLQTIVAREIEPALPSVVTVGRFEAGRAANVIAGRAELEGTIRAHDPEIREHLIASVRRVAESTAKVHGAELELEIAEGAPVLVNRGEPYEIAREAAKAVVGESSVTWMKNANMGGEDFGYFMERVPGCYIRFGARAGGPVGFPAHSGQFDFDEEALGIGAAWFVDVALRAGEAMAGRRR